MTHSVFFRLLAGLFFNPVLSFGGSLGEAPDALFKGPYAGINSLEYKLPPEVDPYVLPDRNTELWARVTWPTQKTSPSPLVVFLHGNHATCGKGTAPRIDNNCSYTSTGSCPADYVVTPNHAGYQYLADHMASWGFIVVSINANRGINCGGGFENDFGLNLARGRLVLKHLSTLFKWPSQTPPPQPLPSVARKILWNQVGLMGHSRGGEGMRAALMYLKSPEKLPLQKPLPQQLRVQSLYEIGAVDGQSSVVLNPEDVTWNQLLPMCDGDVSSLEGRFPFERLTRSPGENEKSQKSLFYVWGANHNFFNTEWQVSDSRGCTNHAAIFPQTIGSPEQQLIATQSITSFFASTLLEDPRAKNWAQNFNPLFAQPAVLQKVTPLQLEFYVSPTHLDSVNFEDFSQPTGRNTWGHANQAASCKVEHKVLGTKGSRSGLMTGAEITWPTSQTGRTESPFYQMNAAPEGSGWNVSSFEALEFRVSQILREPIPQSGVSFSVAVLDSENRISNLMKVSDFQSIKGPVHSSTLFYGFRIPLVQLKGVDLTQIRSVRFIFDQTPRGKLLFSNVRISKSLGIGATVGQAPPPQRRPFVYKPHAYPQTRNLPQTTVLKRNRVVGVTLMNDRWLKEEYEMELETADMFPALNQLPILHLGKLMFASSRYTTAGLQRIAFRISKTDFQRVPDGAPVTITYGIENPSLIYLFGPLNKSAILNSSSQSR
ncbi:MAG: hypothetical protein K2X47_00265 [Bdellovibrionales bacterium]|nr:hypothetical protein [Bdellovibrionales bacterium]